MSSLPNPTLPPAIESILFNHLFSNAGEKRTALSEYEVHAINIDLLDVVFHNLLSSKKDLKNIGIDLPLSFGDFANATERTVVIALDPKRNDKTNKSYNKPNDLQVTIGSVFSLHPKHDLDAKQTDYKSFISYLTRPSDSYVYLTDIYKIYYEFTKDNQTITSKKDPDYTKEASICYKKMAEILSLELNEIKPDRIITLGKDAGELLGTLIDENKFGLSCVEHVKMPHLSPLVTRNIDTIGNLFHSIGVVTNNLGITDLGQSILENKVIKNLFN